MAINPPAAANAALYDKTQRSGNTQRHIVANIHELLTSLKGATKGGRARKPTYGTRQAAKVAGQGK